MGFQRWSVKGNACQSIHRDGPLTVISVAKHACYMTSFVATKLYFISNIVLFLSGMMSGSSPNAPCVRNLILGKIDDDAPFADIRFQILHKLLQHATTQK
jgi:hypothetical protein